MRCKTCDYSLWNITAHKCPECGTDFKPSDFHFVPNSVRFLCPHCEQDYYGTSEEGHLVPRTFHCVKCAQRIDMDDMLLLPTAGVDESRTAADVMPWLQRKQFGWFKGWIKTVGMSMVAPHKLVRALPRDGHGTLGESCFFALATNTIIMGFGIGLPLAVLAMILFFNRDPGALGTLGGAAVTMVLGGAGVVVVATLWALLTHGLLRISGKVERSVGSTMQAMYYSSAANLPLALPCLGPYCGGYFVWVWWLVSAIIMVIEIQKVGGLRATLCVGAGPLLGIIAAVAWFAWIVFMIASIGGGGRANFGTAAFGGYTPMTEAIAVRDGMLTYANAHNGAMPAHMIEVVVAKNLTASDFAVMPIGHDESMVSLPTAAMSLDQFQYLPPNRMTMAGQAESAAQPANIVAHRLGDVVFTYHGIGDLSAADPNMWIAIISPDPDQVAIAASTTITRGGTTTTVTPGVTSMTPVAITASGQTIPIPPGMMASYLQAQNAMRAAINLPPLPDPSTVRNSTPATNP